MKSWKYTLPGFLFFIAATASASSEVWIAHRNPTVYGTGTITDPWDAPTAARFDEILRTRPSNTTINIGPGVFATGGGTWSQDGTSQPLLQNNNLLDGINVRGSGIGITTIRLEDGSYNAYTMHCIADIGPNSLRNYFSVRDLTIDCNFANAHANSTYVVGISARSKNVHIENIEIVGVGARGAESFGIEGWNETGPGYWVIRNAIIHKIWPGSSSALSAIHPAGIDVGGLVHGCNVDLSGAPNVSGTGLCFAGSTQGLSFIGNTASGCIRGVHVDTPANPPASPIANRGIIITGNRLFDNVTGIAIGPVTHDPSGGKFQDMLIADNFIELWRTESKGVELFGGCTGVQISGNTIIKHPSQFGVTATDTAVEISTGASNNVIRDNMIHPELKLKGATTFSAGKWQNVWYDNMDTNGHNKDRSQRTFWGFREDNSAPGASKWQFTLGGWAAGNNPMSAISSMNEDGTNLYSYMLMGRANGGFVYGHNTWIDPSGESGLYVGDADSGNLTVGGWVTAQTGTLIKPGSRVVIQEGSNNSKMGMVTLAGGLSPVINNSTVSSTSRIFLTTQVPGITGTPGAVRVHARGAGWFQIKSTTDNDTSQVAWMIVDPN